MNTLHPVFWLYSDTMAVIDFHTLNAWSKGGIPFLGVTQVNRHLKLNISSAAISL